MTKSAKPKQDIFKQINKVVGKVFWCLKAVAHLIFKIIEQAFRLVTFIFNLLVKLVSNPSTPCVVAIILFMIVSTIAAMQWYAIGVWLGQMIGINQSLGIGSGILGVLLGLGLNVYQLAPTLWRIRQDIAKAYLQLGIDVENAEISNTPNEKLGNWLSSDYGLLKAIRLVSYGLETGLVIGYCALGAEWGFFAIAQAAISLLLPEQTLALVSSTISVLGSIGEKMAENAEDDSPADNVYL
jgi:hypothetical protein